MFDKIQFGVIPFTNGKKNTKVVLVTSKTQGYWIFPKGNPIKNKTDFQSAEQEAFEEAGLRGKIQQEPSYTVSFQQNSTSHKLTLFPMEVEEVLSTWPEMGDRKRRLVTIPKALSLINFAGLQDCLRRWHKDRIS